MKSCALLTAPGFDYANAKEKPLEKSLKDSGWDFDWVSWRDPEVDWSQFEWALIRTTWDYYWDRDFFVDRLKTISRYCTLMNPVELVEWNSHKSYLKDLTQRGVRTLPTLWTDQLSPNDFKESFELFSTDQLIVKPQVGASSHQTVPVPQDQMDLNLLDELWKQPMMVQPFFSSVQETGEFSAIFFAGELSHAIIKKPKQGEYRSQEEFGSQVTQVSLTEEQMVFCKTVLRQVPQWSLYARVDFLLDHSGVPHLIELELIEPSLFWQSFPEGAAKLVEKINLAYGKSGDK